MHDESGRVKPFDLASAAELKRRLLADLPPGTVPSRQRLCELPADPKGWFAVDPRYFKPGAAHEDHRFPAFAAPATVFADVLVPPAGEAIVAAVDVVLDAAAPTHARELELNVAVDSARVMVAAASRIHTGWRVGGPACAANLLHATDFMLKSEESKAEIARAVSALRQAGFELEPELERWQLAKAPSDADLVKARGILREAAPNVSLNVYVTETGARLDSLLAGSHFAVLEDAGSAPFAVVVRSGFGDGIYYWDELLANDRVVGYHLSFVAQEGS